MAFDKQALVIGNDNYESNALPTCVYDAQQTTKALRAIDFRVTMATDVDSERMVATAAQFVRSIRPGSVVLFYYSGHGAQFDGRNILQAIDSDKTAFTDAQNLIEQMHRNQPRLVIAILDCCRTYIGHPNAPRKSFSLSSSARRRVGLAPMSGPPSTIIGYGCPAEGESIILPGYKNSLYTHYLLRRIGTPNVDIETLLKRVAVDVQRNSTNEQLPFLHSSCHERIYLNARPRLDMTPRFEPALIAFDRRRHVHRSRSAHSSLHAANDRHHMPKHHHHHQLQRIPWTGAKMPYPFYLGQ